ncbi:MAG TPA: hypothetical protein VFZ63_06910 [Jiangellaceae bacterium]
MTTTIQTIPSTQSGSVPEDPDLHAVLRAVHLARQADVESQR